MELQEAREAFKKQEWRYPSSKMKLENIIAKLDEQEVEKEIAVQEEELKKPKITTIDNMYKRQEVVEQPKVRKMTTRIYNNLKKKGLI